MSQRKRNTTLDILKAVACLHVVLIHCVFPDPVGTGAKSAGRFAVAFFLCVSGYYFAPKGDPDSAATARRARHIFGLLLGSELFYAAFAVFNRGLLNPENLSAFLIKYFSPGWIEKYFIVNQPPVYFHLWYLYALLTIYLLSFLLLNSRKRLHIAYLTIPFSVIVIALVQEIGDYHLFPNAFRIPGRQADLLRSSFFFYRALPFFLSGALLRELEGKGKLQATPARLRILPALAVVFQACAILEGYVFPVAQFYLGSMLTAAAVMIYAIMKPDLRCGPMEYIGEKLSVYVYILHVAVMNTWDLAASRLHISQVTAVKWIRPALVILLSVGISWLVYLVKERIHLIRSRKEATL